MGDGLLFMGLTEMITIDLVTDIGRVVHKTMSTANGIAAIIRWDMTWTQSNKRRIVGLSPPTSKYR